jgi:hypothetical protein
MNQWGIPDWRDPSMYGNTDRWTFIRWRWEFYRRRDDLRADFEAEAEESYDLAKEVHRQLRTGKTNGGYLPVSEPLKPNEPGFTADVEDQYKYGYLSLPNPRISNQPENVIYPSIDSSGVNFWVGRGSKPSSFSHPDSRNIHAIWGGQIAVIFDINKPIEDQLQQARKVLEREQIQVHGKKITRRRNPKKWLGYLRTLDAREAGASWAEISLIHPHTAQTEQTARDIWQAANALRFNF